MPVVRDLVKSYLRPFVERRESLETVYASQPYSEEESPNRLQIGGTVEVNGQTQEIAPGRIAVTRFDGQDYFSTFSLADLYQEIRQEIAEQRSPKQTKLW